uniref:Inversin n=1 Tax=Anas platyrhynchos TaxID=8839 RepID=A0A8B9ZEA2_ANAPL
MNISANCLFSGSSLASEVHAAAVNGDKSTLQKLIAGNSELKDKEDQFGRTPLMYCVLADRLDCAEALLKAGADVNRADRSRRTALHLAAQKGNYRFMKLLLARRGNWMQKDLEDMTPLHLTTRHKSPKCLALLLKHMAPGEVDTQDKNKQTALHWSAYYNNPEHVKLLIKHDSNIGIPDIEGKIPLHWAANNKDPSAIHTVKCILEAAPTESLLNWQDYEGRTPLHFAVADGNVAVVDVLTSYEGCNVTSYDNLFRTPLHWAALLGHAQIVHLLLERNKFGTIPSDSQGATPLHYAAQSNFAETVEVFLKHPSVKDDSDLEGRTSFMWAAGKGSDDVIRTMLSLKLDIDINMTDKYAGTALHAAALSGHVSTVKLLLEHNAQVDALDVMKHTPLFRACEMGHKEVIQTLIKGGARVDLVDQDGNADVCQILIENKINPNVQDYAGRTPLQCAAYGGYINCMVVLLENNADPNIQDKEGRTALHWLCNNGYLDAIKLLLGFDAFPNHMENSEERYTPLDYALLGEHHEVIQFMLEHGALSIAAIQDIAAFKIQAVYKGYKVRKAFQERKNLLMKHEQLRKDAALKPNIRLQLLRKWMEKSTESTPPRQMVLLLVVTEGTLLLVGLLVLGRDYRIKVSLRLVTGTTGEGNSVFVCSVSCAGGVARSSKQCEAVPKGKRHQQKSRSKEVNDERCSPAGSSRPGSAKTVFVNSRTASVLNLEKTGIIGSRNADDQLCSVAWQSTNIELIPLEIRMQIIEKERTRKELFRKKNYAATVIQRTWRSYHLRQELFRLLGAKRQCKDEDKWSQEAAAFLLQVAWKKQLNHSPLKSAPSCKTLKPVSKTSSAIKTSKQSILKQIYGRSQEGKGCQPARPSSKLKLSEVPLVSGKMYTL